MPKALPNSIPDTSDFVEKDSLSNQVNVDEIKITQNPATEGEVAFERDYSKIDLVDLIDQPAWKTILLDLVETEKMDPWDIDVVLLAEKYIKKISELETNSLRVPANAILACAILVKTKSKYLKLSSLDEEEEEQKISPEQRALFLEELPDLVANRSFREGKISLDELVSSIEDIIHRTNPKKSAAKIIPRMEINFDSTSIEEKMSTIYELIKQKVDSQGIVLFKDLILEENTDEIVDTFLPVLFLMNGGKLIAYQNEFFGEIFVQLIQEAVEIKTEAK